MLARDEMANLDAQRRGNGRTELVYLAAQNRPSK